MTYVRSLLVFVFAFGLAVGACGTDDSSGPGAAEAPADVSVVDDGGTVSTTSAAPEKRAEESADSNDVPGMTGTASIEIAGSTHEFTGADTCDIGEPGSAQVAPTNPSGRTAAAMFTDGDDTVVLDVHETEISPRLTLGGVVYEGYGRPPLVEVTDTGAVFTGAMSGDAGATLEDVTISISCFVVLK